MILKKMFFGVIGALLMQTALAVEECEPAVEAASRMADTQHCDYSKTGLNGVLHRVFSNKDEAVAQKIDEKSPVKVEALPVPAVSNSSQTVMNTPNAAKESAVKTEFNSAQQLSIIKFALLEKASQECPKGFLVEGERYLPTVNKEMKLELLYHCL